MKNPLIWALLYLDRKSVNPRLQPTETVIEGFGVLKLVPQYTLVYIGRWDLFAGPTLLGFGLWVHDFRYFFNGYPCRVNGKLFHMYAIETYEINNIEVRI